MRDQTRAGPFLVQHDPENMTIRLGAACGGDRQMAALGKRLQSRTVQIIDRPPARADRLGTLELGVEKRAGDLAGSKRRSKIEPGVPLDFAAGEATTIGALVSHHFCTLRQAVIIYHQRAALSRDDVLGRMERE